MKVSDNHGAFVQIKDGRCFQADEDEDKDEDEDEDEDDNRRHSRGRALYDVPRKE